LLFDPTDKLISIACIRPNVPKAEELAFDFRKHKFGAVAVQYGRAKYDQKQQQFDSVYQYVALAPVGLLASIKATLGGRFGSLKGLRIDDRG
jgi:hypothetical protein